MTYGQRFNPPPNWPEPPHDGWIPPHGLPPRALLGSGPGRVEALVIDHC